MKNCPCGSNKLYLSCCGTFINGEQLAPSPEALMRSRYTAYTLRNIDYIEKTMRGAALIGFEKTSAASWAKEVNWLGLTVLNSATRENHGQVEFIAYYLINNQKFSIHEQSDFRFEEGHWYYTDGILLENEPTNIRRNDLCPCGSHKKFKKCCAIR